MTGGKALPPAEAAAQAAAAYVWSESHRQGVRAGWCAGWAAAMSASPARLSPPSRALDALLAHPDDAQASSGDEGEHLELDAGWASLFAAGAARRAGQRRAQTEGARPEGRVALDLGGRQDAARMERAQRWYGEEARKLVESEAQLMARFEEEAAKGADLWPVISIKEVEAPRRKR